MVMRNLGNLSPQVGSNKTKRRKGRGIGGGLGKTAGKGHKGQKARKSPDVGAGFEGGQTPLYKRVPKYGFKRDHKKVGIAIINLKDLNKFSDGEEVTTQSLQKKGIIKNSIDTVKLLANGKLERKNLSIKLQGTSAKAKALIEKNGCKIVAG